jgi:hypothetical protein
LLLLLLLLCYTESLPQHLFGVVPTAVPVLCPSFCTAYVNACGAALGLPGDYCAKYARQDYYCYADGGVQDTVSHADDDFTKAVSLQHLKRVLLQVVDMSDDHLLLTAHMFFTICCMPVYMLLHTATAC